MPPLAGRSAALGELRAAWVQAGSGRGGSVVVTGPAGVGRSALLGAFADEVAAHETTTVVALVLAPSDGARGFAAVRQIVLDLVAREPAWAERGAGRWAAPLVAPSPGEIDPVAVGLGAVAVVERATDDAPLLVTIDGIDHIDAASLRVLLDLADISRGLPLLIVMSRRSPGIGDAADLAELVRRGRELPLAPLVGLDLDELCRNAFGDDVDHVFVEEVARLSTGLPGLAVPLIDAAAAAGMHGRADEVGHLGALAVPSLPSEVDARLATVGAGARRLAEASAWLEALLGTSAPSAVVLAAAEVDPADLAPAVAALIDAGLLAPGAGLRWRSTLQAAAVRALVPDGRAGAMAGRAAAALHEAGAPASQVAALLLEVPPVGAPWAAALLAQAALDAEARGASVEAKALWLRQLDEPMDAVGRGWATASVARAELRLGDPEGIARLEALAPTIDDPALRARARFAAGRAALWDGAPERAIESFRRAAGDAAGTDEHVWRRALAGELLALAIGLAEPGRIERAIDQLPPLVDDAAASSVRGAQSIAWAVTGRWGEAVAAARDALADDRLHDPATSDNTAVAAAATALAAAGWPGDALEPLDRLLVRARAEGQLATLGTIEATRSAVLLAAGRLPEAGEAAEAALDAPHANPIERATAAAVLADVLRLCGRLTDAQAALDRGRPRGGAAAPPALLGELRWHAAAARLALARHDPAGALAGVSAARAAGGDLGVVGLDEVAVVAERSAGDRAGAADRAAVLVDRRAGFEGPLLHRARSLLAWVTDDAAAARSAATALTSADDPIGTVESFLRWGQVHERQGRRTEARAPFRSALDLADRCRAEALALEAADGLRRVGGRVRRRALVGVASLTPAEQRVCQLVASGRSNREVADALFLSRKTVEYHLGNAYGKLGISGREQLAEALVTEPPAGTTAEPARP